MYELPMAVVVAIMKVVEHSTLQLPKHQGSAVSLSAWPSMYLLVSEPVRFRRLKKSRIGWTVASRRTNCSRPTEHCNFLIPSCQAQPLVALFGARQALIHSSSSIASPNFHFPTRACSCTPASTNLPFPPPSCGSCSFLPSSGK